MTKVLRSILAACLVGVVACDPGAPPAGPEAAPGGRDGAGAEEMARGLRALPSATVLDVAEDGSPTFVRPAPSRCVAIPMASAFMCVM